MPAAPIHPNKEAFIEGIDHIFAKWTALELAVSNGWGGRNSQQKRDDMVDETLDYFDSLVAKKTKPEPSDIQDLLEQIMSDDFNIMLEDGSALEVAKTLCAIFDQCLKGDFSTVDRLRDERDQREARADRGSAAQRSQPANQGAVDDESSSDGDDESDEGCD